MSQIIIEVAMTLCSLGFWFGKIYIIDQLHNYKLFGAPSEVC